MSLLSKIQGKEYPKVQILDEESLDFIYSHLEEYSIVNTKKSIEELDRANFKVNREIFRKKYFKISISLAIHIQNKELLNSIHGVLHANRVAFLSWLILQRFVQYSQNESDLIVASFFHDLRRKNDNADIGHGLRASKYVLENQNLLKADTGLNFNANIVSFLCKFHDDNYPLDINNLNSTLLHILKLADSLDRIRQPKIKWWPDFSKNEIAPSKSEIEISIINFLSDFYEK